MQQVHPQLKKKVWFLAPKEPSLEPERWQPQEAIRSDIPPTRAQLAKRLKTAQLGIEEIGAILDDLLTKVNHNGVRSVNLAMKNSFSRLKELQLKLRTRLPEAEDSHVRRTARIDASQQTTKNRVWQREERKPSYPTTRRQRDPSAYLGLRAQPRTQQRRRGLIRLMRLVITPSAGLPYSEVLSLATRDHDARLRAIGENVTSVKSTAKGELLVELCAEAQGRHGSGARRPRQNSRGTHNQKYF